MEISAGKLYRLRGGTVDGPISWRTEEDVRLPAKQFYPWISLKTGRCWTMDGRYTTSGVENINDIVEEIGDEPAQESDANLNHHLADAWAYSDIVHHRLKREAESKLAFNPPAQMKAVAGMTLRDYFAGQLAAALVMDVIKLAAQTDEADDAPNKIAEAAYDIADAMMAERNKERD